MPDTSKQEIKLFYCYAHEDKAIRDELEKYLNSLKHLYSLRNWHDREIQPGQEWEQAIENSLNTAHLILLLISPDFMNSEYCYGKEMQRALERHEEGTCKVIPIILRPTFLDAAPFNKLQMLPTNAKPITRWSDRDEAFHDVVKEINLVLKDLLLSLKSKKDWLDEGISFHKLKRYEYALEAFEQALRLDANYLEAYQEKGMTLFELERYDYALEAFEQALHLNPNHIALSIAKGQTLNALERYEEALTVFEQAIHLDPNLVSAYIGRDKALQQLGISREAQEELASQLAKTQQQLASEQERSEYLENELREVRQQLSILQKQLKDFEGQLQQTRQQRDQAQEQLAISKKLLKQLESQLQLARQTNQSEASERLLQLTGQQSTIQEKQPEQSQVKKTILRAASKTDVGRKAEQNEDSPFTHISEDGDRGLFIVADGMGDYQAGEVASKLAVQKISESLRSLLVPVSEQPTIRLTPFSEQETTIKLNPANEQAAKQHKVRKLPETPVTKNVEELLKAAIRQANKAILSYGEEQSSARGLGCTVTTALIQDDHAYVANIGNSRTYLFHSGELTPLTKDHSLVARMVEAHQIDPEDVYSHPQRNLIYRSLGAGHKSVDPDVFHVTLRSGDSLLLCSDGLWEMVRHQELLKVFKEHRDAQKICDILIDLANANGGEDNITAIVVQVQPNSSNSPVSK